MKPILFTPLWVNATTRFMTTLGPCHLMVPSRLKLNSVATSDLDRASLFNKFFHSVFTTSSRCLPPTETLPSPPVTIDSISLSQLDVLKAPESLDVSKSMGVDGIPSKKTVLSLYTFQFTIYFLHVSPTKHVIPNEWKYHSITPIHKSGDKSQVTNNTDQSHYYVSFPEFLSGWSTTTWTSSSPKTALFLVLNSAFGRVTQLINSYFYFYIRCTRASTAMRIVISSTSISIRPSIVCLTMSS